MNLLPDLITSEENHKVCLWDEWSLSVEKTDQVPHIEELPEKILHGDFFHKISEVVYNFGKEVVVSFKYGITKKIYLIPQIAQ